LHAEVTLITSLRQLTAILAVLQSQATLVIQRSSGEPASELEVPAVEDPLPGFARS
jgi:hypothetical protein